MRFTSIIAVFGATVAVSANLIVSRSAQTVLSDLANINSKAVQLNQTISNFQGDTITALAINSQSGDVSNALQQATKDVQSSSAFSNTDAANIVNAVAALSPVVFDTLATLIRKKPQFQTVVLGASANTLIESDVQSLKTNTDQFSTALTAKLPTVLAKLAPFLVADIDYHYNQALNAYKS